MNPADQPVKKAIIPAAGHGTRMLPITKTVPKEILPLVDKPIIQVVVEELVEAGIENIIIVTSPRKAALVDYFGDVDAALVGHLQAGGPSKAQLLEELESVKHLANFAFVEQHGVYGTGTPVLCAEPYVGNEPFIYTFADDFFVAQQNSFLQMIQTYQKYNAPVVGCLKRSADEDYTQYGYVAGQTLEQGATRLEGPIVERPGKEAAPSDLASLGGFVLTPEVFGYLHQALENLPQGREFYFHTALSLMIKEDKQVIAREIADAEYFDTGTKLAYMKSVVAMAARHPEIGQSFQKFLHEFVQKGVDHES